MPFEQRQEVLYVVNMRPRHPKPEVEAALREAEAAAGQCRPPLAGTAGASCGAPSTAVPAVRSRSGRPRRTQVTMPSGCAPQSVSVRISRRRVIDEDL